MHISDWSSDVCSSDLLKRFEPNSRNWAIKYAHCWAKKAIEVSPPRGLKRPAWWSVTPTTTAFTRPKHLLRPACKPQPACRCNAMNRKGSRPSASVCSAWTSYTISIARWPAWKKRCKEWSSLRFNHDLIDQTWTLSARVGKVSGGLQPPVSFLPVQKPRATAHVLQPQTASKGFGIGNAAVTACTEQFLHRHAPHFQKLVGIQLRRPGKQPARKANVDDFRRVGDGQVAGAGIGPLLGRVAGFLEQLAPGANPQPGRRQCGERVCHSV